MRIWPNICTNFLHQCHSAPSHCPGWAGPLWRAQIKVTPLLLPWAAKGLWLYSNHCNVRALFITLLEMKCSKHSLRRLQESKEHWAPTPVPGAGGVLEGHLGKGPASEGLALPICCWHCGLSVIPGTHQAADSCSHSLGGRAASQCSPGRDELCPLQHPLLRAYQR